MTCPVGILLLLSTLFGSGATQGRTGSQIAKALQLRSDYTESNLTAAMKEAKMLHSDMIDDLLSVESTTGEQRVSIMTASNGVFLKAGYEIHRQFQWSIKSEFRAEFQQLDFTNQSNAARQINLWVNAQTKGLVPRFFDSPNEVPQDTRLAIFNVFTFKDNWQWKFTTLQTRDDVFHVTQTSTVHVPMMQSVETLKYANLEDKGFSIVSKPMENDRFSMLLLLPNKRWDFTGVDKVLRGEYSIPKLLDIAQEMIVTLKMPKFKIEKSLDLIRILESMGITDLFRRAQADLRGITTKERLYINLLKQSTVLKVDENGVEAAAVTSLVAVPTSLVRPDVEFYANHPFVCILYDRYMQIPLLVARVSEPRFDGEIRKIE